MVECALVCARSVRYRIRVSSVAGSGDVDRTSGSLCVLRGILSLLTVLFPFGESAELPPPVGR